MRTATLLLALLLPQEDKIEKGTTPCGALKPAAHADLQNLLEPFQFTEKEFSWELRETRRTGKISTSWVTFPSAVQGEIKENNVVWGRFWNPVEEGKGRPAAVLLHWLGGGFSTLEIIGHRMAEGGIPTLLLYLPHYGPRRAKESPRLVEVDLDRTRENMRQSVLDVRRARDWLAGRPGVDPSRVGIVGISLGAVVGSLAAGVDGGFGRSVFIIGGGDLPGILFQDSKETAEVKRKLEEAGHTRESMAAPLRGVEPLTFAARVRREDVLMINAEADEIIPRASTEKLHEALGRPEILWLKGGHYSISFQVGTVLKAIGDHLHARKPEAPR